MLYQQIILLLLIIIIYVAYAKGSGNDGKVQDQTINPYMGYYSNPAVPRNTMMGSDKIDGSEEKSLSDQFPEEYI